MEQYYAVAERPRLLEPEVHPDIRSREQRPALPQNNGMDENAEFVDQAVPHERGGQIGAAQGDVAAGLRLQFAICSGTTS